MRLNLCKICACRLSGCTDFSLFLDKDAELEIHEQLSHFVSDETCNMCLGILDRKKFENYVQSLRSEISNWPLGEQKVSDIQLLISGNNASKTKIFVRITLR